MGGMEHVRVLLPAKPKHETPSPEELHTLSQTLLQQSNKLESSPGSSSRLAKFMSDVRDKTLESKYLDHHRSLSIPICTLL